MNLPAKKADTPAPSTIEDVLFRGDLSDSPRSSEYVGRICQSLSMNPLTGLLNFSR
jgi:hypothetical protein